MIFDEINFDELPESKEEAFTEFVRKISSEYNQRVRNDRSSYSDQNGNYVGAFEPERSFVTSILAFLDEYGIQTEIEDISDLLNDDFSNQFGKFKSKVEYLTTRFKLRQGRINSGTIGTMITLGADYKTEIGSILNTVRKIVNQEVKDPNKRDSIFKKITSLQSEVDRDQTTIDALFGRMLDLSQAVGKSAENISPLIDKIERIKKLFWDNSEKVEQLPKPDRPKMITKEPEGSGIDDEIPF